MLPQGPHIENHKSKIPTKQDSIELNVGLYYRNNGVQLPKGAEFHFKACMKDCHPVCVGYIR